MRPGAMYVCVVIMLLGVAAGTTSANNPTPTPGSAGAWPAGRAPVGDQGVVVTPTPVAEATSASLAPTPVAEATLASATPDVPPVPTEHTDAYEAGTAELTVWVCSDRNNDSRCSYGEGVAGVPFVILDAVTGVPLATGVPEQDQHTDASGRKLVRLELRERTTISVDLPLLALSRTAQQQQGGVIVVVPWEEAPKVLP